MVTKIYFLHTMQHKKIICDYLQYTLIRKNIEPYIVCTFQYGNLSFIILKFKYYGR